MSDNTSSYLPFSLAPLVNFPSSLSSSTLLDPLPESEPPSRRLTIKSVCPSVSTLTISPCWLCDWYRTQWYSCGKLFLPDFLAHPPRYKFCSTEMLPLPKSQAPNLLPQRPNSRSSKTFYFNKSKCLTLLLAPLGNFLRSRRVYTRIRGGLFTKFLRCLRGQPFTPTNGRGQSWISASCLFLQELMDQHRITNHWYIFGTVLVGGGPELAKRLGQGLRRMNREERIASLIVGTNRKAL